MISMQSTVLLLGVLTVAAVPRPVPTDISDPAWPGGAFPALPWASWSLRDSVAGFFLGNVSGPNGAAETAREASLGVVGLGWQLGLRDGASWAAPGGLEARQQAAARELKALRPSAKVLVSAELDATCPQIWGSSAAAVRNRTLARDVFMTWPNGTLWLNNTWGGLFEQPWYNWTAPAAVDWWIEHGPIAAAMRDPAIDGVYLDGADPDPSFYAQNFGGSAAALHAFQRAQRRALARAISVWRARQPGKWLGAYGGPRVRAAQRRNHCPPGSCAGPEQLSLAGPDACAATMRGLIARSTWRNQTLIIALPNKEPNATWVPLATFECRPPWWAQDCALHASRDPAPEVAAFLVARGPSALLQIVMQPARSLDYRSSSRFPSLLLEPGRPLEEAREVRRGVFERRWSNMTVRFDCSNYTGSWSWSPPLPPPPLRRARARRAPSANCSVSLSRTISGECSSSRFGCPSVYQQQSMWAKRNCCGDFVCDGWNVTCCSRDGKEAICACGPTPAPTPTPPTPAPAPGGVFFVDGGVKTGGNGSLAAPFRTVQRCVDVASSATSYSACVIAAGTYREAVLVPASGGVTLRGANGSDSGTRTVLAGTYPVDGDAAGDAADEHGTLLLGAWAPYRGAIWRAYANRSAFEARGLPWPPQQLFIDGAYVDEARWPNANGSAGALDARTWAAVQAGSGWGWIHDPALSATGVDWTGARATLNLGSGVFTWVRRVQNYSAATSAFNFTTQLIGMKRSAGSVGPGSHYFLQGAFGALDAPGEWWLNASDDDDGGLARERAHVGAGGDGGDGALYVWAPDGRSPAGRVAVKARDYCISGGGNADRPTRLSGLELHGCTFNLRGCRTAGPGAATGPNSCVVEDVGLQYPTYNPWVDFRRMPAGPVPAVTTLEGEAGLLRRLWLRHSNNGGLLLVGSGHRLEDSLIESTNWLGSLDFPAIKMGFSFHGAAGAVHGAPVPAPGPLHAPHGLHNTVTRCTVRGSGNTVIATSQLSNEVSWTHVEGCGLLGGDNACVHADNAPTDCNNNDCTKQWHHNWVHDAREKCMRCDDGSLGCWLHHNVVWNCGMPLRNGSPAGILLKGWNHTVYANTIFNVSHAQGDLCAWTKFGQNSNSQFFNIAARTVGTKGGPFIDANHTRFSGGLHLGGDWRALGLEDASAAAAPRWRFQPTAASPLRAAGVAHVPWAPPAPDGVDVGAYAFGGDAWRPGCTFHPRCNAGATHTQVDM